MKAFLYEKMKRSLKVRIQKVDKTTLLIVTALVFVGWVSAVSISPSVAKKISLQELSFIKKQTVFCVMSLFMILGFAILPIEALLVISVLMCIVWILVLCSMPFVAGVTKGSRRWLNILGFSVQPSEILKPFFLVVNGFILRNIEKRVVAPFAASAILMAMVAVLLFLQPDIGMTIIYAVAWLAQLFLSNAPMVLIFCTIGILFLMGGFAYIALEHVRFRVKSFWHIDGAITPYQVKMSLASMSNGGLWGTGIGEGRIKKHLPDAHSDYIFAAIGEEVGWIVAMMLIAAYAVILFRNIEFFKTETSRPKRIIGMGIVAMLFAHIFFSVGVSINLLPSKGTTLPFLSYGGSSMISFGILVGVLLSLTKREARFISIFQFLAVDFLRNDKVKNDDEKS